MAVSPAPPRGRLTNVFDISVPAAAQESWYAHYLRDVKVGQRRVRTFQLGQGDRRVVVTRVDDQFQMKRFEQVVDQTLTTICVETPDGALQQLGYELESAGETYRTEGWIENGELHLAWYSGERTGSEVVPGADRLDSSFSIDRYLQRHPMEPGDQREVTIFLPLANRLQRVFLSAAEFEETDVAGNRIELLRVDARISSANWNRVTYWVDRTGTVHKTIESFLDRRMVRVRPEVAQSPNLAVLVDLGLDSKVPLSQAMTDPHTTREVHYRLRLKSASPVEIFSPSAGQRVTAIDEHTADVVVQRVRPSDPPSVVVPQPRPGPEDLASNRLMPCEAPRVVALAKVATQGLTDPWDMATALENYIHRMITELDYSQVLADAAEVAHRKRGDCSEMAVLLAAACRNRGIPARVALGLIYSEEDQGLLYHMWTEVWIRDRWIPLDATLGRGGTGAAHLKLRDSALAHESIYDLLTMVVGVVGQLEAEIIHVEYELTELE